MLMSPAVMARSLEEIVQDGISMAEYQLRGLAALIQRGVSLREDAILSSVVVVGGG